MVTSLVSVSPALPKKERRYRKKRSRENQEEAPPEIPVKGIRELPVSRSHSTFSIFWPFICLLVSNHFRLTNNKNIQTSVQTEVFPSLSLLLQGRLWNVSFFFPQTGKKTLDIFGVGFNAHCVAADLSSPCIYSMTETMLRLKWKLCLRFSWCSIWWCPWKKYSNRWQCWHWN